MEDCSKDDYKPASLPKTAVQIVMECATGVAAYCELTEPIEKFRYTEKKEGILLGKNCTLDDKTITLTDKTVFGSKDSQGNEWSQTNGFKFAPKIASSPGPEGGAGGELLAEVSSEERQGYSFNREVSYAHETWYASESILRPGFDLVADLEQPVVIGGGTLRAHYLVHDGNENQWVEWDVQNYRIAAPEPGSASTTVRSIPCGSSNVTRSASVVAKDIDSGKVTFQSALQVVVDGNVDQSGHITTSVNSAAWVVIRLDRQVKVRSIAVTGRGGESLTMYADSDLSHATTVSVAQGDGNSIPQTVTLVDSNRSRREQVNFDNLYTMDTLILRVPPGSNVYLDEVEVYAAYE
ncbi:hypothetical protein ACFWU3_32820 [Streptomyces sp. NPDC058685]|uniref:hypothetical protein n=1 Tax=Streptomyces sp. NPDC058685 TaxID=3346598 RepID=UPI003660F97F